MIEDLRQRILITILFIAIYRLGSFVVLPGIDPSQLTALRTQTEAGLMSLLNMFSGGAFSNASIFALGIMPYISASIVIQLLGIAVPAFQKMQREGESGRRKMNQYTRYLTILILLVQAPAYLTNLKMQSAGALSPAISWTTFMITSTIILAACLSKRCKGDLRMWAILSDAAAACVLSVLPEHLSELGVYICIFAMGFQWCVFAGKYGYPCSTIFSTNNLRQFVDAWVQAHLFRDSDHIPRMNLYGGTLLAFHAGVIAECVLWAMGWGSYTILPVLLPAALAFVWQRQDFRMRERIEEAFEPHHTA